MEKDKKKNENLEENCCCCGNHEHEECGCSEHDHDGCDCGCEEMENPLVDLEDENGNIVSCEMVDGFEYKENEYVLVQNPEDGSTYLFKVVGEGDEGELVVPDDDEFEEVSKYYESLDEEDED